jgi:TP901 family phage tail tape measure protein
LEFKKSGFDEQDSMELARVASLYQNVADQELTAGEAANFIVSQMKAYNMTAKDAEHIIGAVNEVSNKYAVSSADIATNIGKASAAMATGNITYEQGIGLTYGSIKIGLIAGNPLEPYILQRSW